MSKMDSVEIPTNFLSSEELSKAIWEYWMSLLKTNYNVPNDQLHGWDVVDDDWKKALIQTIHSQVVNKFNDYKNSVELEIEMAEAFRSSRPTPPLFSNEPRANGSAYSCYICTVNHVFRPGSICKRCRTIHTED